MFQDEGNVIQQIPLEQQLFSWLIEGQEKNGKKSSSFNWKMCLQFFPSLLFFGFFLIHYINNPKMHIGSFDGEMLNR